MWAFTSSNSVSRLCLGFDYRDASWAPISHHCWPLQSYLAKITFGRQCRVDRRSRNVWLGNATFHHWHPLKQMRDSKPAAIVSLCWIWVLGLKDMLNFSLVAMMGAMIVLWALVPKGKMHAAWFQTTSLWILLNTYKLYLKVFFSLILYPTPLAARHDWFIVYSLIYKTKAEVK
jgi:hypothetical protein